MEYVRADADHIAAYLEYRNIVGDLDEHGNERLSEFDHLVLTTHRPSQTFS